MLQRDVCAGPQLHVKQRRWEQPGCSPGVSTPSSQLFFTSSYDNTENRTLLFPRTAQSTLGSLWRMILFIALSTRRLWKRRIQHELCLYPNFISCSEVSQPASCSSANCDRNKSSFQFHPEITPCLNPSLAQLSILTSPHNSVGRLLNLQGIFFSCRSGLGHPMGWAAGCWGWT